MQGHYGNEFYNAEDHAADPTKMTDTEVRDELRTARTRLLLAAAFVDLVRYAYQTLLSHGINYQALRAYQDTTILDDAKKLPLSKGADRYISWIGRVKNDITAAVARKGLRALSSPKPKEPK